MTSFVLSLTGGHTADGTPGRIALTGTDLVVGSGLQSDWRLGAGVAERHCQFGHRGGRWLIVDLGGGTRVNGRPLLAPSPVEDGDVIAIGDCVVRVSAGSAPAETRAHAGASPADVLLAAAGIDRTQVTGSDGAVIAAAGSLLRLLVAGVVRQLSSRARARAELGAGRTQFWPGGAINPLKMLPAGPALAALLDTRTDAGAGATAVTEAFADLEAHEAATLAGMQQALAKTLERFSPSAIRQRAQSRGLLTRVLPSARAAALWQAYESDFDGVVKGSSDAFVELFAEEFARTYRDVSSGSRPPS